MDALDPVLFMFVRGATVFRGFTNRTTNEDGYLNVWVEPQYLSDFIIPNVALNQTPVGRYDIDWNETTFNDLKQLADEHNSMGLKPSLISLSGFCTVLFRCLVAEGHQLVTGGLETIGNLIVT